MIVKNAYFFIHHGYIIVMDFCAIVLEPGDQLYFKELARGRVVLLVQKKVGVMEGLDIIHTQHQIH